MLEADWTGRRVTVRRVVERAADGRLLYGDVVGDLVGLDAQTAVIETRAGLVEVPLALVAVAKLAPPSTADVLALERVAALAWRPADTAELDGWVLRADGGRPRRANAVLPLRQLRRPVAAAIDAAREWYAERGQSLLIMAPTEVRRLLDAGLGERGWPVEAAAAMLTRRLSAPPPADPRVQLAPVPDDGWLACFSSAAGPALLGRHGCVTFASVRDGTEVLATARGVVDEGWLGIAALEVTPAARRQGLAGALTSALWAWGAEHGATRSYLQVELDNAAARALYAGLGYHVHHEYHYRRDPGADHETPPSWA